ncbi:hypothetical protein KCU98_g627, partial [Aureobasidium melanogenum]
MMDVPDDENLPASAEAPTRRNRKRGPSSIVNGTVKRTRDSQPTTPGLVRGSISDLVSNASPSWEPVNGSKATPSASPGLTVSKGKKTWREAIVNILKDSQEGLTSHEIVLRVRSSPNEAIDQDKVRAAVSATLSTGAKGDKPIFEKRLPNEANKVIWALKDGGFSNLTNELLGEHSVAGELDAAMIVANAPEHESNDRPSMTNGGVSGCGNQSTETNVETNGDDAATPLDTSSAVTAQKINLIIEGAGLSPRDGGTDEPAAAPVVEPSQQSHLQELQQTSPPLVDRQEKSSARELQPTVHESRVATMPDLLPGFVAEDRPAVTVPLIAPEMESTDVVVGELQDASVGQGMSSLEVLRPLLADKISKEVARFNSRRQQELPALEECLPFRGHSNIDVHAVIEDMLRPLRENVGLDSTLAQPAVLVNRSDAHRALDDIRLASDFRKRFDEAISDCDSTLAAMASIISHLNEPIASIQSFKSSLQAYKAQASASQKSSRKSLNAFIDDQDDDDQVI